MRPFVVHSFGKCASRAIEDAIRRGEHEVYHCHYITNPERESEWTVHKLAKEPGFEPYVIIPIRELVSRNISAHFENYAKYGVTMQHFLDIYPHQIPLQWFEIEPAYVWGFDVYAEPFDKERGWQVYGRILVIRMENLDDWHYAFTALTGLPALPLRKVGRNRKRAYRRFLKQPVPDEYVKKMQASEFYRHFYG